MWQSANSEKQNFEDVRVRLENMTPEQIKHTVEQVRQENQISTTNEVNETKEPPRENENITVEVTVKLDAETKELKDDNLDKRRKILQIKFTNAEDTERLSKIWTVKKEKKLIERIKIAMKEIINESEETLETTNEIMYAAEYVIMEKLNGK